MPYLRRCASPSRSRCRTKFSNAWATPTPLITYASTPTAVHKRSFEKTLFQYNFMVHHPLTARREAPPTGVIETLSAGYAAVNRQPWVLLLPVLLNLFLWLGPRA